jgi:hypothetical protein
MVPTSPFRSSITSLLTSQLAVAPPAPHPEWMQDPPLPLPEELEALDVQAAPFRGLQRRVRLIASEGGSSRERPSAGLVDPSAIADTTLEQMMELSEQTAWEEYQRLAAVQTSPSALSEGSAGSSATESGSSGGSEEALEEAIRGDRIQWKDPRIEDAFWMGFAAVHAEENRSIHPCFWERVTVAMQDFLPQDLQERLASVLRKRLTCTHFTNLRRKNSYESLEQRLFMAQRQLGMPLKPLAANEHGFSARWQGRSSQSSMSPQTRRR